MSQLRTCDVASPVDEQMQASARRGRLRRMAARIPEHPGLDVDRPFTRADAVAAGVDPKVLRTSRFRRIFRGFYVSAGAPDHPLVRTRAALVIHPASAYASHTSAARLYGLPVPVDPDEHVSVERAGDRRPRPGVVSHVAPTGARVRTRDGTRVSPPLQMFVELASMLSLVDLVVVGDAMARVLGVAADDLRRHCSESVAPGARAARHAAGYVRDQAESPMETRLRMLLVLAGLPEPDLQHVVALPGAGPRYRLDLAYPAARVAVEYDGRQHAEDSRQWNHDLRRREALEDAGWKLLVVTAQDLYRRPDDVVQRVCLALVARGALVSSTRPDPTWRAHFRAA